MYIVTGGAGFIGSAIVAKLNSLGIRDILVVDDLGSSEKWRNLNALSFDDYLDKQAFLDLISKNRLGNSVRALIHMGACSATTERNADYLINNNFKYTRTLAEWCRSSTVRFIYASSAATYGMGEQGYDDDLATVGKLRPLNLYGFSKQLFDVWVAKNGFERDFVGLKFFNVYGPNEYHKGDMRSVVCKAFEQIRDVGKVKLFKSNSPDFGDGEQKRDFIYVKDCAEVVWWFVENAGKNGIFNLGTGEARSWNDLVKAIFNALGRSPEIEYVPMPADIAGQYQNFTEAKIDRLKAIGCPVRLRTLDSGVYDYVKNYLTTGRKFIEPGEWAR